jgi:hypothetical protein
MRIREALTRRRFLDHSPNEQHQLDVKIYGSKAEIKDALSILAQMCTEEKQKED